MKYTRNSTRGSSKADGGSAWISYSDMMAALLLVFVLILCYSVYQYFLMLESKTAELDAQSAMLTQQGNTLATQQTTLSAQAGLLDEQQKLLSEQQAILAAQQQELVAQQTALANQEAAMLVKQNELDLALSQLTTQQQVLADQKTTLKVQEDMLIAAQVALANKEAELQAANNELVSKQNELANATILLGEQQFALDQQQQKLDDLVGIRTKIVKDLTEALAAANLKASVDANTGDIVLESNVFFDVGKNDIKAGGKQFLEQFVPVYLSVLLRDEYIGYLGEIIIEGHTDTQGEYLMNLELSQRRALSVATFCLEMKTLNENQLALLRDILTAKGRSYSDPIYNANGTVNMDASRRVEFKFRMKDAEMIDEIRQILDKDHQ